MVVRVGLWRKLSAEELMLLNWKKRRLFFFFLIFIYLFIYLNFILFYFFKLYIIVLVLPNIKMNPPQVYMCSPSWTILPPPSPHHPSGSSQCTSPKHPVRERERVGRFGRMELKHVKYHVWKELLVQVRCTILEKTLESPLDCKEIQLVHLKRDQSWVFIGRTDAEAETPVLWPPHAKSWLIGKYPDAGRVWGQEREGDDRRWDGWNASPIRWTWVWVNFRSWWWTRRPGRLRFMGPQRVGQD